MPPEGLNRICSTSSDQSIFEGVADDEVVAITSVEVRAVFGGEIRAGQELSVSVDESVDVVSDDRELERESSSFLDFHSPPCQSHGSAVPADRLIVSAEWTHYRWIQTAGVQRRRNISSPE